MVIECGTCGSRFRLSKSLFKESRAIRVRCRKCGGQIVVENPDLPREEEAPPPESGSAPVSAPEAAPKPAPPPPMEEARTAMADLLREIEEKHQGRSPEPPVPAEPHEASRDLPPVLTRPPDPSCGTEALASALEELFKQPAAPPPDREVVPSRPAEFPKKAEERSRPPYANPLFPALAVAWLLLLAGGAYLFGTGYFGKKGFSLRSGEPSASSPGKAAPQMYEITGVSAHPDNAVDGGPFLAVTGNVSNLLKPETGEIRVRATLLGKDNDVLSEMEVLAGNWIEAEVLRTMRRDTVEQFLVRQAGVREIPQGASIPFLAVFYDPPGKIASVEVRAVPPPGK